MTKGKKEVIPFNLLSVITVSDENTPSAFPAHWHNAAEFVIVRKDGCVYRINDTTYELCAGDILLIWPHQVHEIVKVPPAGASFMQFPAGLFDNHPDLLSVTGFLFKFHKVSAKGLPELSSFISDRIFAIKNIQSSSDPFAGTRCRLCIYEMLLKIADHVIAKKRESGEVADRTDAGWQYIHAACRYITENAAEDLTQADVADQVGVSTYYFSRLFNQYMHMSFPAYLAQIRVKKAAGFLLDKSLSITECAFMAGFQSTTAFNKAFHEIIGYAPREYRKLYR
ncbi:MAG: helix-turn-helix transcriptional regulator [Lachnospiraceae bacterium]|nr:helix-turn-helix transcriptional regulator [Lachnospiraceae bacterium]